MTWQNWLNALLGLWVIAVPFLGFTAVTLMWVLVISGIVIAVIGFWGGLETSSERESGRVARMEHQRQ